jgi:hypothetical protein
VQKTMFKTHLWYAAPSVTLGPGLRKTQLACSRCGKRIIGRHPSHTERCYGK